MEQLVQIYSDRSTITSENAHIVHGTAAPLQESHNDSYELSVKKVVSGPEIKKVSGRHPRRDLQIIYNNSGHSVTLHVRVPRKPIPTRQLFKGHRGLPQPTEETQQISKGDEIRQAQIAGSLQKFDEKLPVAQSFVEIQTPQEDLRQVNLDANISKISPLYLSSWVSNNVSSDQFTNKSSLLQTYHFKKNFSSTLVPELNQNLYAFCTTDKSSKPTIIFVPVGVTPRQEENQTRDRPNRRINHQIQRNNTANLPVDSNGVDLLEFYRHNRAIIDSLVDWGMNRGDWQAIRYLCNFFRFAAIGYDIYGNNRELIDPLFEGIREPIVQVYHGDLVRGIREHLLREIQKLGIACVSTCVNSLANIV